MHHFRISSILSKWKLFSPRKFFKFKLSHLDSLIFFTDLISIQLSLTKITSKLALIYFNIYWWLVRNFRRIFSYMHFVKVNTVH